MYRAKKCRFANADKQFSKAGYWEIKKQSCGNIDFKRRKKKRQTMNLVYLLSVCPFKNTFFYCIVTMYFQAIVFYLYCVWQKSWQKFRFKTMRPTSGFVFELHLVHWRMEINKKKNYLKFTRSSIDVHNFFVSL